MCIIVAKPASAKLPSNETLKECWSGNSHGAGIMWAQNNVVHIIKGFMDWKSLEDWIDKYRSALDELPVVLHFRYATHGSKTKANCHPFPIMENLKAESIETSLGIAHNGVIHRVPADTKDDMSDTMVYIRDYLRPFYQDKNPRGFLQRKVREKIVKDTGSKFAFLYNDGTLVTAGDFNINEGVSYSNHGWKRCNYSTTYYSSNRSWDDGGWYRGNDTQRTSVVSDNCDYAWVVENGTWRIRKKKAEATQTTPAENTTVSQVMNQV